MSLLTHTNRLNGTLLKSRLTTTYGPEIPQNQLPSKIASIMLSLRVRYMLDLCQHNRELVRVKSVNSEIHDSDKFTKRLAKIDTDKVDIQNLRSVIVFLNDNFRINTCMGRLIIQINDIIIKAIKTYPTTNSFLLFL